MAQRRPSKEKPALLKKEAGFLVFLNRRLRSSQAYSVFPKS
jgi:hypothetical protein